ncbi:MAG: winged helix-turn-helix domain-containing protein [Xanthomonadales bacterium]|nr:winged helix-turn-helix domain-containing protein [Xanthomonadales bacterium]
MPRAARLRVGDCVVDVARREVLRPGAVAPARITVKALQVLLVLAEDAGRVVPRERLLDTVWAGTLPTLDVVTQAIAGLRRAFADRAHAPACIETIPKSGYVLLAGVEWLPEAPASVRSTQAPLAPASPRHRRLGRWRWLAALMGFATLGVVEGASTAAVTDGMSSPAVRSDVDQR